MIVSCFLASFAISISSFSLLYKLLFGNSSVWFTSSFSSSISFFLSSFSFSSLSSAFSISISLLNYTISFSIQHILRTLSSHILSPNACIYPKSPPPCSYSETPEYSQIVSISLSIILYSIRITFHNRHILYFLQWILYIHIIVWGWLLILNCQQLYIL